MYLWRKVPDSEQKTCIIFYYYFIFRRYNFGCRQAVVQHDDKAVLKIFMRDTNVQMVTLYSRHDATVAVVSVISNYTIFKDGWFFTYHWPALARMWVRIQKFLSGICSLEVVSTVFYCFAVSIFLWLMTFRALFLNQNGVSGCSGILGFQFRVVSHWKLQADGFNVP